MVGFCRVVAGCAVDIGLAELLYFCVVAFGLTFFPVEDGVGFGFFGADGFLTDLVVTGFVVALAFGFFDTGFAVVLAFGFFVAFGLELGFSVSISL